MAQQPSARPWFGMDFRMEAPDTAGEAPATEQDQPADAPEASLFDERFDPANLPDELRPRYRQMQADYTQKTQSLAEQRQAFEQEQALLEALRSPDPELQNQALQLLGYEAEDQEYQEDDPYEDPYEARLAALEAAQQQAAQQGEEAQHREQLLDYVDQQFDQLEQSTGRTFSDAEVRVISGLAGSVQDANGLPDVRQAYDLIFSDVLGNEKTRWIDSKQTPQPGRGTSGTETPDLSDEQVRRQLMAQAMSEAGTS